MPTTRIIPRKTLMLGTFAVLAGCAAAPKYQGTPPPNVAVLPFDSMSNDVGAPEAVRKVVWEKFKAFGFIVAPLDQIDAALRPLGVTQGGQLRATTPEKLVAATGADLLCYGMVEKFDHVTLGIVEKRVVRLNARLVNGEGTVLWNRTRESSKSDSDLGAMSSLGSLGKAIGGQLKDKVIEGALVGKLRPETDDCVNALVKSLPKQGLR
jgi:hypothetical protein